MQHTELITNFAVAKDSKSTINPPTMSLGTTANLRKNGILLAYIAGKMPGIHLRKLLKVVYLMDERFMAMRGFPLTWFDYYAWAKGPVAPEAYAVKEGAFADFVSSKRDSNGKRKVFPAVNATLADSKSLFSDSEMSEIDRMLDVFKDMTADELSDITHIPTSPWSRVVADNHLSFDETNGKSDCLIPLTMLFAADDPRQKTYDNAKWEMELQARLNVSHSPGRHIKLEVVSPSEREQLQNPAYTPAIP